MHKVVVIGGGSGSFTILSGLKNYNLDLSAIVSMADDGGSSGFLRSELGILPLGDVRNCLIALSEETPIMKELFGYRFANGEGLKGHSFGNLFLAALREVTGSERDAVSEASKILKVRGRVLPVTFDDVRLCADLEDGRTIVGETNIDIPKHNSSVRISKVFLRPAAHASYDAVRAIESADVIIIGPGDLYSSIIPNLLVGGIPEAIAKSSAKKIFICNLMTKRGETDRFKVSDFVNTLVSYLKCELDHIICNSSPIPESLTAKYASQGQMQVFVDLDDARIVKADLLNHLNIVRHHPEKLAKAILDLI